MKRTQKLFGIVAFCLAASSGLAEEANWKHEVKKELPTLGHRNWVVVADSAYPAQTAPGIKTIYAGGSHLDVIREIMEVVGSAKHVKPVVFLDAELDYVPEKYAKGVGDIRDSLKEILGKKVTRTKHEDIIKMLDEAGQQFRVLVIKTDLTLPYTSVFLRLDCGYWSDEAESALRSAMKKTSK